MPHRLADGGNRYVLAFGYAGPCVSGNIARQRNGQSQLLSQFFQFVIDQVGGILVLPPFVRVRVLDDQLMQALSSTGLTREEVYITSAVRSRPYRVTHRIDRLFIYKSFIFVCTNLAIFSNRRSAYHFSRNLVLLDESGS